MAWWRTDALEPPDQPSLETLTIVGASTLTRLCICGGTLLIVFALAEFSERRKEFWRRAFASMFRSAAFAGRRSESV
jgi:hypothetical protein